MTDPKTPENVVTTETASDGGNLQNEQINPAKQEDKQPILQNEEQNKTQEQTKTSYGKFKDPQELIKAYGELEREFTKKSQRLKELENSLRPFESEQEWKEATDKFFERTPSAVPLRKEIAREILFDPALRKDRDCFDKALVRVLAKNFKTPEQLMSDGQFLKDYVLASSEVKDAVISGYLADIASSQPPRTVGGGGNQCVAPARRPVTVEEAGRMFLKDYK